MNLKTAPMPFPLTLPEGYEATLFGVENGARDLEFSPEGILLLSSPKNNQIVSFAISNNGEVHKKVIISNLDGPHGIAFFKDMLFVAEKNRLSRYKWDGTTQTAVFEKTLMPLPPSGHAQHSLVIDQTGNLYIKIGSSCNVCIEEDPQRAAILKTNLDGSNPQIYATGLRNAAFLTLNSLTNRIWATENGRDHLGDELPPEEINLLEEGKNYGWPVCFGNKVQDIKFDQKTDVQNPCIDTQPPAWEMQAHSAPLGLTFVPKQESIPVDWEGDLLVAYHGSWNRSIPTGYKIVRLNVENDRITSEQDFITGFMQKDNIPGRPVDLIFDNGGNLYISDDKFGAVYRISKKRISN